MNMEQSNENINLVKLSVSKVCHEFANYLSRISFLLEDITDKSTHVKNQTLLELQKSVDISTKVLCLIRSIYSTSGMKGGIMNLVRSLYNTRDIQIIGLDSDGFLDIITNAEIERLFATVLYIIFGLSSSESEVSVCVRNKKCTFYLREETISLPKAVEEALLNENFQKNVFNAMISYAKDIASMLGKKLCAEIGDNVVSISVVN